MANTFLRNKTELFLILLGLVSTGGLCVLKQTCRLVAAGLFRVCMDFRWTPVIKGLKLCYDLISFLKKVVIK